MTQWVDEASGGRDRGPAGLARAWVAVLTRPRRFFERAVAPGDQGPGLVFATTVVAVAGGSALGLGAVTAPVFAGRPAASALLALALVVVVVAPVALHFVAAVLTAGVVLVASDRGGVGETVQVVAYATAPCALAGLPVPGLRVACCAYGTVLLIVGVATVHDVSLPAAALAAAVPALATFGYMFGGVAASAALVERLGLSAPSTVGAALDATVYALAGR